MRILGLSAFYHDSAAALIVDGEIAAAAQEERFRREKHYAGFPTEAVRYCLAQAGVGLNELDHIAFYEKPLLKFERLLETYLAFAPAGFRSFVTAMPVWIKEKLFQRRLIAESLREIDPAYDARRKLLFSEHHLSHAASAFYPSPFARALVLTMDGVGEWATSSVMRGEGRHLHPLKELHFPHSLGLLYSAFTYFCGFKVNSGEYKLMGLAPYGEPTYVETIRRHLIDIRDDGSFRLNMRYFNYCTGLTMTNRRFERLFGRGPRAPEGEITQLDMDLARSIQEVTEEVVLKLATHLRNEYGEKQLCLAGGVALNSVANGKLLRAGVFDDIWIQPAAGDAGGALGAALAIYHLHREQARRPHSGRDGMRGAYLGPDFDDDAIKRALEEARAVYHALDEEALIEHAAAALAAEKVIGWFQGRMEFGPRALGARSILGDPRSPRTQSVMNLKIKYRESFRPFAPSVLREDVGEYFDLDGDSPYMLIVAPVRDARRKPLSPIEREQRGLAQVNVARSDIPAVTHVDYSARIQTVHADTHPIYHRLIRRFKALTGYGLVVNTSFNVRGEPIVCTPADAWRCFMNTAMDELYIGRYRLVKAEQEYTAVQPSLRPGGD